MSTTTKQSRINPELCNRISELARSGQTLLEICETVGQPINLVHGILLSSGVSLAQVRSQREQRRRIDDGIWQMVCQLGLDGETIQAISTSLSQPTHVVAKILRHANISPMEIRRARRERARLEQDNERRSARHRIQAYLTERYASGETFQEIAETLGVTREAVRKRMVAAGFSPRDVRRRAEQTRANELATLTAAADSWVEQHIGCTMAELASELGRPEDKALALLSKRSVRLLIHQDETKDNSPHKNTRWSPSAIVAALQQAAEIHSPLSKTEYQNLVNQRTINGPSSSRLIHIYGSWANTCQAAGIQPHEIAAINYTRQWTREEMVQGIYDFIRESENLSKDSYETWRKCGRNLPGYLTLSNEFGGWRNSIVAGLRRHRCEWAVTDETAATIASEKN